jgi:hypothetical protein
VTLGAQHRGVFGVPRCIGANHTLCEDMRRLLLSGAYSKFVQKRLVQAEYWVRGEFISLFYFRDISFGDILDIYSTLVPTMFKIFFI